MVLLPTQTDRYWYACERRGDAEFEFQAVPHSCYQRVYEIARRMEMTRDRRHADPTDGPRGLHGEPADCEQELDGERGREFPRQRHGDRQAHDQ